MSMMKGLLSFPASPPTLPPSLPSSLGVEAREGGWVDLCVPPAPRREGGGGGGGGGEGGRAGGKEGGRGVRGWQASRKGEAATRRPERPWEGMEAPKPAGRSMVCNCVWPLSVTRRSACVGVGRRRRRRRRRTGPRWRKRRGGGMRLALCVVGKGGGEGDDEIENHGTASFEQVGEEITMKTRWRTSESGAVPACGGMFECALCCGRGGGGEARPTITERCLLSKVASKPRPE